jgi:ubiquinone/menaquinone biosynthesis C-methylase UbiE
MLARLITGFMRQFFRLLYHPFAWTYDWVAGAVSLGRWKQWVLASQALIRGDRVLELGFGPGHLQEKLLAEGRFACGLDESWQMVRQARGRLARRSLAPRLARGLAQNLPYPSGAFHTVVATFPTLYIVDPATLAEIGRVLAPDGRLVVLMSAWITGRSFKERFLQQVFRATAQVPPDDQDISEFLGPYQAAGFQASLRFTELPGARLMFIIASKPKASKPHELHELL